MAGFTKYQTPSDPRHLKMFLIDDSETLRANYLAEFDSTNGNLAAAVATHRLVGVVQGFFQLIDGKFVSIETFNATDLDALGGTYTKSTKQYAAAADNTTVDKVYAQVDTDPYGVWSNSTDGTIGTTAGSGVAGYYCDIADYSNVDETGPSLTSGQMLCFGLDPRNSSNGLYMIAEHAFNGVTQ